MQEIDKLSSHATTESASIWVPDKEIYWKIKIWFRLEKNIRHYTFCLCLRLTEKSVYTLRFPGIPMDKMTLKVITPVTFGEVLT